MFAEDLPPTEFSGWCDWDVVHDLSGLDFTFNAAKFTAGWMASPIFIQRNATALEWYPTNPWSLMRNPRTFAWDELQYLRHVDATILQQGLTPEVDLFAPARYAVHMYRAKHDPELFAEWQNLYFPSRLKNGGTLNKRHIQRLRRCKAR